MSTTSEDSLWDVIANACQETVDKNSSADLMYVITNLMEASIIPNYVRVQPEYENTIIGKVTHSGKYIVHREGNLIYFFKNPGYELTESVKQTNASVRNMNDVVLPKAYRDQNKTTIISLVLAGVSVVFIILSFVSQLSDNTELELKALKEAIQKNDNTLKNIYYSLEEIKNSIRLIKTDTFLVK
jgi:hypothetical protein